MTHWHGLTDSLQRLLARAHSHVCVLNNPGNAGDALISAGMWRLLGKLPGLEKQVSSQLRTGSVCIYPGGGNLVPGYEDCAHALAQARDCDIQSFVLLPHSVKGHAELLRSLDARFHIFCRDRRSYAYARDAAASANVYLSHDLALCLDSPYLRAQSGAAWQRWLRGFRGLDRGRGLKHYPLWQLRLRAMRSSATGTSIEVFRGDSESTRPEPAARATHDISAAFCADGWSREMAPVISFDIIDLLQRFQSVKTDRLHIGIAGLVAGLDVRFMDNSYGKISAIYEHSLQGLRERVSIEQAKA
jgi:exopolysaccharide biosynthesis predicted pyruvyltransferase EpsI